MHVKRSEFSNSETRGNFEIMRVLYGKEKFGPKLCLILSNSWKTSRMHVINRLEFSNSEAGDNFAVVSLQ